MLVPTLVGVVVSKINASKISSCVTAKGELYIWGDGVSSLPEKVITISTPVDDVSLGATLSVAKDINGMLWSWG